MDCVQKSYTVYGQKEEVEHLMLHCFPSLKYIQRFFLRDNKQNLFCFLACLLKSSRHWLSRSYLEELVDSCIICNEKSMCRKNLEQFYPQNTYTILFERPELTFF